MNFKRTVVFLPLLLLGLALFPLSTAQGDVNITAQKYEGITVDGLTGDWSGVSGTTVTMIRPFATADRMTAEVKIAYDDANIYVLLLVNDDYDYNATDHDKSAAVAVLFQIDSAATPDMGGGKGNVDIWHWELDQGPGVVVGFNLTSGNDPIGNLDDEWANSTSFRKDDKVANEIYGAWSHTGDWTVGATGKWVFEFQRALTTSDARQDRQFAAGQSYKMAIAYWDPDETGTPGVNYGWTDVGHFASCRDPTTLDFSWLAVTLATPTIETDVGRLQTNATSLKSDVSTLQTQTSDLNSRISTLNSQLNTMTTVAYSAVGVAIVGMILGVVGLAAARKKVA